MDFQFYPTPRALAVRAWAKFKNRSFTRVLEPSAGDGALASLSPYSGQYRRDIKIDVIEIDMSKHPVLQSKGLTVVGLDFLEFEGCEIYSHLIMNPPFAEGAKHVLKGWDGLWDGEIVAILNAETVRNPFSQERKRLVDLIEAHGSVEYIQNAFKGQGVAREAEVEIALVHLVKPAESNSDWIGPIIDKMAVDTTMDRESASFHELPKELALPNTFVGNQVATFRLAVKAMRESVKMQAVATHYARNVGRTMGEHLGGQNSLYTVPCTGEGIREAIEGRYMDLKDRAWASILRSTETLTKLSAKVQREAEAQFEQIKRLDFTESNVYSFLLGLVQSQPQMQDEMMLDVFDQITKYHADNTVFYKGWKSNSKHRTCGYRIKTSRFILPGNSASHYEKTMPYGTRQMLSDFDKVFAMLDGKTTPSYGLVAMTDEHFKSLYGGERIDSDYFSLRYYPQAGTIHFFARRKDLVDRLNRFVGRLRKWLPAEDAKVPDSFWAQFDKAEKFDTELRAEALRIAREAAGSHHLSYSQDPIRALVSGRDEDKERAQSSMSKALDTVLTKHKLNDALAWEGAASNGDQLLLAA